jgi:hypothetical protein
MREQYLVWFIRERDRTHDAHSTGRSSEVPDFSPGEIRQPVI